MTGPYDYLSASEWPLMLVSTHLKSAGTWMKERRADPRADCQQCVRCCSSVLHGDVYRVRADGSDLVGSVRVLLERSVEDPVLDRWSHLSWHVGEGRLLWRVPEHPIRRLVR